MGFIDLVGVSEENVCDVKYKLKNIIVKANNKEEHSVYVEIEFEIFVRVFENREINVIQDMYSPSRSLKFKENKISTMVNMKNTQNTISIRENVRLDEPEYLKICDVQIVPRITETEKLRDKVRFNGDIDLNFILSNDNEDDVITLNRKIPFEYTQDIDGINAESRIDTEIVPKFREFIADNMEVNSKIDLELRTNSYNLETVNVIDNIEETEDDDEHQYSMVVYFVKKGDTLWEIAKKYKSTVDDIVRVNDIENPDKIQEGMQLFIPKCSNCRTRISA